MRFSECMRQNGVSEFPDPEPSGELTIDGVLNGSGLDSESAAWKQAISACKDLQPSGFTGRKATPKEQDQRLLFAQCIREHGVTDFPDPAPGDPLVDTNKIPSSNREGGMDVLNAAMEQCGTSRNPTGGGAVKRTPWVLALVAVTVAGCGGEVTPAAQESAASTVEVQRGDLVGHGLRERDADLSGTRRTARRTP